MAPIRSARNISALSKESPLQGFWDHTADPKAPTWIYLLEDQVKLQFGRFRSGPRFNPHGASAEENLLLACHRLNLHPHQLQPCAFDGDNDEKKVFCPVCTVVLQDTPRTVDRHVNRLNITEIWRTTCTWRRNVWSTVAKSTFANIAAHSTAKARGDLLLKHEQQCASNPANTPVTQPVLQTAKDAHFSQAASSSWDSQSLSSASPSSFRSSVSSSRSSISSSRSSISPSSSTSSFSSLSSMSSASSVSSMAPSIRSNLANPFPHGLLSTPAPSQKEAFDVPAYLGAQFMIPSDYSPFIAPSSHSLPVPAQHYPQYAAQGTFPVEHAAPYAPGTRSHAVGAALMPFIW